MLKLEEITVDKKIRGIESEGLVTVISVKWFGENTVELIYSDINGKIDKSLISKDDEDRLEIAEDELACKFDADGHLFRLVSEANRIKSAHLYDPLLAVNSSNIEPFPHQITAVYEEMIQRRPLKFLLADDPGAGKTIMAGLLIKELMVRGDVKRCLIVCPGSLAEQWQNELNWRFQLPFEIMVNDKLTSSRTGNYFAKNNLVIARLDTLSRSPELQENLAELDAKWDLIICDEAHKMSAQYFGKKIKQTKRYLLGMKLSKNTRHFLLMTATPHNGKEEDFQLFLALLDSDRFEKKSIGKFEKTDNSDLMRRMVKEKLVKFDSTPLFPKRFAKTVPYQLSDRESELYEAVTSYVRTEYNRALNLDNNQKSGNVGFALTILQRRLASSPEAIYQSLIRRGQRLKEFMNQLNGFDDVNNSPGFQNALDEEDIDHLDELPEAEYEESVSKLVNQATAARTVDELKSEINHLRDLENLALDVRNSGKDKKWQELSELLRVVFDEKFDIKDEAKKIGVIETESFSQLSLEQRKLVIFTEHTDTLTYLKNKISEQLGDNTVAVIHGKIRQEDRLKIQSEFKNDNKLSVLIATDAAGEGINLQCAHLMVNYDLPWNPNRLEQRFGRIHRIGQKNTCLLWNLVASETREGEVYHRLLEKIEKASIALGGQVFDVVGSMTFEGKSLKDLLIEAITTESQSKAKEHLNTVMEGALDLERLKNLMENNILVEDQLNSSQVQDVRMELERAEIRRLQPHFIESFFLEAFKNIGGKYQKLEEFCYRISQIPVTMRQRGLRGRLGEQLLASYDRIVFDKKLLNDYQNAEFVGPGHPLLDSTIDALIGQNKSLFQQGCILVDESGEHSLPRLVVCMEHTIHDSKQESGERNVVSKQIIYIEVTENGEINSLNYAPYLDYRPLDRSEPEVTEILELLNSDWLNSDLELKAQTYAIESVIPTHHSEVKKHRLKIITKVQNAVKERLLSEITYWDRKAEELKLQAESDESDEKMNSDKARQWANELQVRYVERMKELELQKNFSSHSPDIIGRFLVVPKELICKSPVNQSEEQLQNLHSKQEIAERARKIVMDKERDLGYEPIDRETEKLGYDIESKDPKSGRLRFIEVKGRIESAETITVTKNEILFSLNKPDDFILVIVEFKTDPSDGEHHVYYIRNPFKNEPDFGVTSVNYKLEELKAHASLPI